MDRKEPAAPSKSAKQQERERRLAESLRANLEKRKAQARQRDTGKSVKK